MDNKSFSDNSLEQLSCDYLIDRQSTYLIQSQISRTPQLLMETSFLQSILHHKLPLCIFQNTQQWAQNAAPSLVVLPEKVLGCKLSVEFKQNSTSEHPQKPAPMGLVYVAGPEGAQPNHMGCSLAMTAQISPSGRDRNICLVVHLGTNYVCVVITL